MSKLYIAHLVFRPADMCPYLSMMLKEVYGTLGTDAARTGFIAVTTDSQRDTLQVIAARGRDVGLFDVWHFVASPLADVRAA